jgi:hypothetical protein
MQLVVDKRPGSELSVLCLEDGKSSRILAIFVNDHGESVQLFKDAQSLTFMHAHAMGGLGI